MREIVPTALQVRGDWQPYLFDMRQAARDLGSAEDLTAARAAAKRITEQCQGCHTAVGIEADFSEPEID